MEWCRVSHPGSRAGLPASRADCHTRRFCTGALPLLYPPLGERWRAHSQSPIPDRGRMCRVDTNQSRNWRLRSLHEAACPVATMARARVSRDHCAANRGGAQHSPTSCGVATSASSRRSCSEWQRTRPRRRSPVGYERRRNLTPDARGSGGDPPRVGHGLASAPATRRAYRTVR